ncbi:flagellar motor protein MotD [Solimicrobium silvestre]|uniref:Flagellar motor protein n=1 Tax=Solimicrobium silvestre TaxID=2099400 RepID=A0A2S9GVX3_9BURK|nr:flagellar motor protein MotD [Solimicrobium silvestre]PRC91848.1 Flagellar motor protein [Solimicrobium silvestre]
MRKRRPIEDEVNHERWLVSYADFITLLFAFFVVMYSLSSLNEGKYRVMSDSVITAFGQFRTFSDNTMPTAPKLNPGPGPGPGVGIGNGPGPGLSSVKKKSAVEEPLRQEREKMTGLAQGILSALAPLIREGKVRVTQTSRGVSIDINASVLFASAEAKLTRESSQALLAIASVLASDAHAIQVEGYTDNQPIKNGIFPSNWELSAVRAGSVVRLFMDNGIAEDRLTAIGQGAKMPVATNDTAEGRSRNRRVNITILALLPDKQTEVPINDNNADKGAISGK